MRPAGSAPGNRVLYGQRLGVCIPLRPGLGRPAPVPAATNFCGPADKPAARGWCSAASCVSPGKVQARPKGSRSSKTPPPPFRRLPPPYPPLASPLPTRTGKEGHGARSPALQKQLEATVIWSPPGVSGAPGSLPSKAQPGPNQSRALFRASHQPSSTRPAEDGGKKNRLMQPQPSLFSFFLSG